MKTARMPGRIRPRCLALLALAAALLWPCAAFAQTELPHLTGDGERFDVGMFKIIQYPRKLADYDFRTQARRARIDSIWRGHPGGFEACNVLHYYDGPRSHPWPGWPDEVIDKILTPIAEKAPDVRIIMGALYRMFVSTDPDEFVPLNGKQYVDYHLGPGLAMLEEYITKLCEWEQSQPPPTNRMIAGWYLDDEPFLQGRDLAEYYRLVDAVREIEDRNGFRRHPLYVAIFPGIITHPDPKGRVKQAGVYSWINYDGVIYTNDTRHVPDVDPPPVVKTIGDVVERGRFPSNAAGTYEGEWYFTIWEADHLMIDYYKPLPDWGGDGWSAWVTMAREDFREHGRWRYGEGTAEADDWSLHAIVPTHAREFGGEMFPDREDLHAYVRHVLDLNVDGIWFYSWRPSSEPYDKTATKGYWADPRFDWASVIENEIEGRDQLLVGRSSLDLTAHVTERFEIATEAGSGREELGDALPIYSAGPDGARVVAMTAGDFDGDGADDLVAAHQVLGTGRHVLYFTRKPEGLDASRLGEHELQIDGSARVIGLTSGDLDADGLDELILALSGGDRDAITIARYSPSWETDGSLVVSGHVKAVVPGQAPDGRVTALAAGDYDGNGVDELLIAMASPSRDESWFHLIDDFTWDARSDPRLDQYPPIGQATGPGVSVMVAADYDADNSDDLLLARALPAPGAPATREVLDRLWFDRNGLYENLRRGNLGSAGRNGVRMWTAENRERVAAVTAGDYDGDGRDEALVAIISGNGDGCRVHWSEDPHPSTIGDLVFAYPDHVVSAMASGDFTPSGPEE